MSTQSYEKSLRVTKKSCNNGQLILILARGLNEMLKAIKFVTKSRSDKNFSNLHFESKEEENGDFILTLTADIDEEDIKENL